MNTSKVDSPPTPEAKKQRRVASQTKYAVYTLADALEVAKAIYAQGGGTASVDELAAFLGYKSSNNGAYYDRTSAARMFGLIQGQGSQITLTPRAQEIISPVFPEQVAKAMIDAFISVPLFRAIYEEFQGKQLPPTVGLKNLLRTKYGVPPSRIDVAHRALMESAEQAGFFSTRGTRTQLILPRTRPSPTQAPAEPDASGDASTDDHDEPRADAKGRHQPERAAASMEDLTSRYLATLIEMLGKQGEPDPELMAKIEKLLGLGEAK